MIEMNGLCSGYNKKDIITDISLGVSDGKVTALLGPNGSGKSTLLKAAAGIIPITAGELRADGIPASELSPKQLARHISYMAQSRNTPDIVASKMILHGRFPYLSYPRRYSREDLEAAARAARLADAEDVCDCLMTELSGGQKQKVYFAMSLAQNTKTVLMDEPLSFLDIRHQLSLMDTADALAKSGKAVLLVMHDIRLAMQRADRICVMSSGRLVADGSSDELFDRGILDEVFGIRLRRMHTEDGYRYYYL